MSFNGRKLAGNEQIDRKFMFMKKVTPVGCLPNLFVYQRSQVSVYRTTGPLVFEKAGDKKTILLSKPKFHGDQFVCHTFMDKAMFKIISICPLPTLSRKVQ